MSDPASQVRSAIERGEFGRAGAVWEQWSNELARDMADGTLDPADWADARELYHWSRNVLVAERAHLLHRLNKLHVAGAYGPAPAGNAAAFVQGRF